MKTWLVGLLVLANPLTGAPTESPAEYRTLYYFFTPESPGQAELARRVAEFVVGKKGAVRLRSVLLVEDFGGLGRVKEESPFTKALKELGRVSGGPLDLAIYDEEGLALARSWKITKLPALALVAEGRVHVATGSRTRPEDLEDCR